MEKQSTWYFKARKRPKEQKNNRSCYATISGVILLAPCENPLKQVWDSAINSSISISTHRLKLNNSHSKMGLGQNNRQIARLEEIKKTLVALLFAAISGHVWLPGTHRRGLGRWDHVTYESFTIMCAMCELFHKKNWTGQWTESWYIQIIN